jgi:hypothetical protein
VQSASNVTVAGGWVFYSDFAGDRRLYRQKLDGSEREALTDTEAVLPFVAGDWIVYQELRIGPNPDPNADVKTLETMGRLFRMKWDGTDTSPITSVDVFEFAVSGDRIAYSGNEWGDSLYAIGTDGTGLRKLTATRNMNVQIAGDWVYYVSVDPTGLHRIRWDGTGEMLVNRDVESLATNLPFYRVAGDAVFYANAADGRNLYRSEADGSDPVRLTTELASNLFVADGWVYYVTQGRVTGIFGSHAPLGVRIRTDGTRRTEMKEESRVYLGTYEP